MALSIRSLKLERLHERHPGLTAAAAGMLAEAAIVALHRFRAAPAEFTIEIAGEQSEALVTWEDPSPRVARAHANDIDATEQGAYSMSLAALELEMGYVAVQRAETMTGADYYVSGADADPDDLENAFRLEVSGVGAGDEATCRRRLAQKIEQAAKGRSELPAFAAVVGFSAGVILVSSVVGETP